MCMVIEEGKLQVRSIFYLKFSYSPIVQWLTSPWHRQDAPLAAFLVLQSILCHLRVTINLSFVLTKPVNVVWVKDDHVAICPLQEAMPCPKERERLQHPMNVLGPLRKLECSLMFIINYYLYYWTIVYYELFMFIIQQHCLQRMLSNYVNRHQAPTYLLKFDGFLR